MLNYKYNLMEKNMRKLNLLSTLLILSLALVSCDNSNNDNTNISNTTSNEETTNIITYTIDDKYSLDNYIDASKYDYVCQEKGLSVIDSLNIMGMCKYFIIGNTTFGWWAQYLSAYPQKVVIAPKPWTRIDDSDYIYCNGWETIDVSDYIANTKSTPENA